MKNRLRRFIVSNTFFSNLILRVYSFFLSFKSDLILGRNVKIGFSSTLEGSNYFGDGTVFTSSELGFGSYISEFSYFQKTKIGRYTSIGPNVRCVFGKHPSHTFVSTHPSFFSTRKQVGFSYTDTQLFQEFADPVIPNTDFTIAIGNDVWIGANVAILDGVTIGDGAIIAANALVNKDIEPYSIYGGVPAKHIKKRFEQNEIDFLMQLKWWDKPKKWIENASIYFNDISILKTKYENNEL